MRYLNTILTLALLFSVSLKADSPGEAKQVATEIPIHVYHKGLLGQNPTNHATELALWKVANGSEPRYELRPPHPGRNITTGIPAVELSSEEFQALDRMVNPKSHVIEGNGTTRRLGTLHSVVIVIDHLVERGKPWVQHSPKDGKSGPTTLVLFAQYQNGAAGPEKVWYYPPNGHPNPQVGRCDTQYSLLIPKN